MTMFLESPVPAIALGALLLATFGLVFLQTGRLWSLYAIGGVLLLIVALIGLEIFVVTDREDVASTLEQVEAAVASNDVDSVAAFISPSRGQAMIRSVKTRMPAVTIHDANIGRDLDIEMNYLTAVPTAMATFTGRVTVSDKGGFVSQANYVRKFTLKLRRENDRWLMYEYEERNLIGPGAGGSG